MSNNNVAALGVIGMFLMMVLLVIGWIMNIVTIASSSFEAATGELVVRVIGIFVPVIGGVIGWF